jgi:hypothetical protein
MKFQISRSTIILGVSVIILIHLMGCNLPTLEELGGGEFNPADLAGNEYIVIGNTHINERCEETLAEPFGDKNDEIFEFVDDTLILSRDGYKETFTQASGTNEYCMELGGGSKECIQWVSNKEYLHVVREPDPNNPGVYSSCYEASRFLSISSDNPDSDAVSWVEAFNPLDLAGNEYTVIGNTHTNELCEETLAEPFGDDNDEIFEFVDDTLILSRDGYKETFTQTSGTNEYCMELGGGSKECIQWVSNQQYMHRVKEPDPNNPGGVRYCYEASRFLSLSDENPDSGDGGDPGSSSHTCDGTQYLQVGSQITKEETNEFGTFICDYTLVIRNTHPTDAIWFYVYVHKADGYQHTEGFDWMGGYPIAPGTSTDWFGSNIAIYTDKDFDGPVMSIPEKLAGIYDSPECAEYRTGDTVKETIAIPINPVCPME